MKIFNNRRKLNKTVIMRGISLCMVAVFVVGVGSMAVFEIKSADEGNVAVTSENASNSKSEPLDTAASSGMEIAAKSAVLMDAGSGTLLFAQNGDEKLPPASVTKIMTMLLAMEAVDSGRVALTDEVTISENAASMGGSQMYMEPGETHTLEELMKGISIVSANDAAVAVAEYLAGSVEIFVENMNTRAQELGMVNTNFVNTNGLPVANHYTSAHDIAVMGSELIKHEKTHEWMTTWQDSIKVGLEGKEKDFGLTNTNKLIKQYNGANGIKTGFTQEAGYCLAGSAERDGMTLVAVVLGCQDSKTRFAETMKLLDYGFANYETVAVAEKGESNGLMRVEKGQPEYVDAVAGKDISVLVKKGEKQDVTFKAEQNENLQAPIKKGEQIGEIVVYMKEKEIDRYPLVAADDVEKAGVIDIYKRMIKGMIGE